MPNPHSRGSSYERHIANLLSKWWGIEDSFWRSQGSGSRATKRGKGQFGDICSSHEATGSFCRKFSFECKKRMKIHFRSLLKPKADLWKWWNKHLWQTPPNRYPILVFSDSASHGDTAMMRIESEDIIRGFGVDYVRVVRPGNCALLVDFRQLLKATKPEQWELLYADYQRDLERSTE